MSTARSQEAAGLLFSGPGEMAERCRAYDWASTPLGPIEAWSQSLRTMASAVIASRNPMLLFWGPHLIQFYNDAFRPSLGSATGAAARHPRALGMSAPAFWTDVWSVIGPQIDGVMTRGEAVWFEDMYLPIERGDGVLDDAWWTYSYSPVRDDDGSINGTLVVCLETTNSVKATSAIEFERRRMVELFRHAPAYMAVVRGPDHTFELVNDHYSRLIGFRDVLGKPAREALPEIEAQGYMDILDRVFATGEPYIASGVALDIQQRADGPPERCVLDFVYHPITEPDGNNSGIFFLGVDVSETVNARAAAEHANKSKSEFLAVMSHELRTPLNAIDGYAALLELGIHGPVTETQLDDLSRIRRSGRHLLGLINDVLNFTRIESSSIEFDIGDFPLAPLLELCDELTAPQRRARQINFTRSDCAPDVAVRADADRVQQILLNLIGNAIKFTPPEGSISTSCDVVGDMMHVSVSDTGCGIRQGDLDRIFEPFVQVDARYTRREDGVGLGLSISRELARAMNGDIVVRSVEGVGSTFTLQIPTASPST